MSDRDTVSRPQIEALLRFLPAFKRQGFWFERVVWESGQVSYVEKSPEAEMFLRALTDHGWLLPAGRSGWENDAENWVNNSSRLASANVLTLRKLFTSWIQKDRLLPGHLGALYERGDLTAALERLQTLSNGSSGVSGAAAGSSRILRS